MVGGFQQSIQYTGDFLGSSPNVVASGALVTLKFRVRTTSVHPRGCLGLCVITGVCV